MKQSRGNNVSHRFPSNYKSLFLLAEFLAEASAKHAIESDASDIHITENKEGWIREKGKLYTFGEKITVYEINKFIETVIPEMLNEYRALRECKSKEPIDGAFFYMSRRFRINIYRSVYNCQ